MKVTINKQTKQVTGLNRPGTPFEWEIDVNDDFTLFKEIQVVDPTEPEIQKVDEQGQGLYKDNLVVDDQGLETYDEVTEARKAISWEPQTVTYTIDGEPVEKEVQVPTEWEDLQPVMVENLVSKTVTILEDPKAFTYDEVVEAKYLDALNCSTCEDLVADAAVQEDDLDLEAAGHYAHTGDGFIILPATTGQVTLKVMDLGRDADHFMVLDGDFTGVQIDAGDGDVFDEPAKGDSLSFASPKQLVTVVLRNISDADKTITSYAFGY